MDEFGLFQARENSLTAPAAVELSAINALSISTKQRWKTEFVITQYEPLIQRLLLVSLTNELVDNLSRRLGS